MISLFKNLEYLKEEALYPLPSVKCNFFQEKLNKLKINKFIVEI